MKILLLAMCFALSFGHLAMAQMTAVQDVLQSQRALIEKSSRRTIGPAIDALVEALTSLWGDRQVVVHSIEGGRGVLAREPGP